MNNAFLTILLFRSNVGQRLIPNKHRYVRPLNPNFRVVYVAEENNQVADTVFCLPLKNLRDNEDQEEFETIASQ